MNKGDKKKRVCQNWHILFFHIPTGSQTVSNNLGCCFSFSHHLLCQTGLKGVV